MGKVSRININTVLTENYMAADYFTGYQNVSPVTGEDGALDYLVGTDSRNRLMIACPKNMGETGHVLLDTGATATIFDVESGEKDGILVGYVKGRRVKLLGVKGQAIEQSCEIDIGLTDDDSIEKLITYRRDYVLYLFAICKGTGSIRYSVKIIEFILPEWSYNIINTGFSLETPVCDCLRENLSVLLVAFDEKNYRTYDLFMKEEHSVSINYPGRLMCFSAMNSPVNGDGILGLFDVDGDRKVYALDLDTMQWLDVKLHLNALPCELNVGYYNGFFHVFISADTKDKRKLYHASRPLDDKYWTNDLVMMPISGEITDFAINKAEESRLGVIFDNVAVHFNKTAHRYGFLTQENADIDYMTMGENGQWNIKRAVVDTSGDNVFEYKCFSSKLIFYDENGLAYHDLEVEVTAECATDLVINNRTCHIMPKEWTTLRTNALGMLCLIQRADELSVPVLIIRPKDELGRSYTIVQHDRYAGQFESITAAELENARLDDSTPLVPREMRGRCGELAELVRESLDRKNFNYHLFEKDEVIAHNKYGIYCTPKDRSIVFGEICEQADFALKIEFLPEGGFTFYNYNSADSGGFPPLMATDGFWGRLCDLTRAVANKAVVLTSMVLKAAEKAVVAIVDFVLDGVKQVASFIVRTVKDMLGAVLALFERFKMGFERVFHWLGQLFSWSDIMAAKNMLAGMIDTQLRGFAATFRLAGQALAERMGYVIDESSKAAARVEQALPNGLDAAVEAEKIPPDNPFYEGQSNNVVYHRIIDATASSGGSCCIAAFQEGFGENTTSLLDEILECFREFGADVYDEMLEKKDSFMKAFATTEVVTMVKALGGVMEELLKFIQEPVGTLVTGLGRLMERLMEQIIIILNTKIRIPLVTALLEKVFGILDITILDVITTVIAIPFTIVHKLICGVEAAVSSGRLGNAYGKLKDGYIWTGVIVVIYYALCAAGIWLGSESMMMSIIFTFLPGMLLLVWTCLNTPEFDEFNDSTETDQIAVTLSFLSVGMYLILTLVINATLDNPSQTGCLEPANTVDILTIMFGITSVIIGVIDMASDEWTKLDILSQRNGILTGIADMGVGWASISKTVGWVPSAIISAGLGGIFGLAESGCIFAEVGAKPFISSILPSGGTIERSGIVEITFDTTMDTHDDKRGTVSIGTATLAAGSWKGKTYTAAYSGLEANKEYFLIVENFVDGDGDKMEKDRYSVKTED